MAELSTTTQAARGTARLSEDLEIRLEEHRHELTGYAYRMLGSAFEAEERAEGAASQMCGTRHVRQASASVGEGVWSRSVAGRPGG